VRIAHQILQEQGAISELGIDPMDVLFFMETTEIDISERLKECTYDFFSLFVEANPLKADITPACKSFLALLKSFISGEIDADKMDYIWRDSYFSGVKYGMFNRDHLLNSFRIGYEDMEFEENVFNATFSLAVLKKGVMALEDFVYARYQLYHELYNHKTVSGFRKILSLAIDEVSEVPEVKEQIALYMQDIAHFKDFTDTFFWEEFRRFALSNPDSYCAMLVRRQPLEYFDLLEDHDEEDVKRKCNAVKREKGFDLIYWQSKISFSKINNYFKTIKVLTNEFGDKSMKLKRITDVTDFFEKFEKKEIYHLFKLPELK
jgi:HD superfamily phosphohydrolase